MLIRGWVNSTVKAAIKPYVHHGTPMGMKAATRELKMVLHPPLARPGGRHSMPPAGRRRGQLIVVAHVSSNEHVEMYIYDPDGSGICHNVGVVAVPAGSLKVNGNGWFTQSSKEFARSIFRNKAAGRDFIAMSTDHQYEEAVAQWNDIEDSPDGYGHGPIREVIYVEDVEIYSNGNTVEFQSWWLNPHQPTYVHVVFPQTEDRSPVGVIGFKQLSEPDFDDRLHLTYDHDDVARTRRNVGEGGRASLKIDGAAVHFKSDRHGTRYFSPRHSKETGRRIEYSCKLGELQDVTSDETTQGMGELVFVDTQTGRELSANEVGGVLNAHQLPPEHLEPRLYVYRIDRVGRKGTLHEPYWEENRPRCSRFAQEHALLDTPPEITLDDLEHTREGEGAVAVPPGESIVTHGRKLKWRGDPTDVVVTRVEFEEGDKGGIAGVVYYEDPRTGREMKTASGFSREQKEAMMADPESYEGEVMMISEFPGHPNRAATFEGWHSDKDAEHVRNDTRRN